MGLLKEFREFAMRGNVIDLAVGVVIGASFGKIISSLVENIFMTPLNLVVAKSGVSFNSLSLKYSHLFKGMVRMPVLKDGKPVMEEDRITPKMIDLDPDILKYGPFLQTVFEFLIIAFALFLVVKGVNAFKKKTEASEPPPPPEDVVLLREIRDALKR